MIAFATSVCLMPADHTTSSQNRRQKVSNKWVLRLCGNVDILKIDKIYTDL